MPEFFRISHDDRASLVWRRQHPKLYDPKRSEIITRKKFDTLDAERNSIRRRLLAPSEITALIGVAVDLHERALEQLKASKWWLPIATSILAFVGAVIGAWIS